MRLRDCAEYCTGKLNSNAAVLGGKYPFFTCSPETFTIDNYAFDDNVILLAGNNANGNFNIKRYNGKFNAYQRTYVITAKPNADVEYLFYALKLELEHFKQVSQGTATKFLTVGILGDLELDLPPLDVQREIAATLSALDDKIAVNTKLNHRLEQMAQAIFAERFGGREPNGILADIADITMGQSPSGESYNEDGTGTVFYQGRAEFGSGFPTRRLFTTAPNRMAESGDVLLSVRAPVGDLNVASERCCIGRGLAAIQSKYGNQSFVLYTMFAAREQLDIFNGTGTVFGSINKNALENLAVYVPPEDEIAGFDRIVRPIDEQIAVTSTDSVQLSNLRDTLLPRLMSGELSVNG